MVEHQAAAHGGERNPEFNFRVVKQCKISLDRQVREAVRIDMRGKVLNRKGMYNRWKLTRLLLDLDWEKKVWEESWQTRKVAEGEEGGDEQEERGKP